VLADWWFSLALSKVIYQPRPDKRTLRRFYWLTQEVIVLSESQPFKGLNGTLAAIVSCLAKRDLMGVGIKNILD
jgi:hypothetical protein